MKYKNNISKMKIIAILAVIYILLIFIVVSIFGTESQQSQQFGESHIQYIETDKTVYHSGETIKVTVHPSIWDTDITARVFYLIENNCDPIDPYTTSRIMLESPSEKIYTDSFFLGFFMNQLLNCLGEHDHLSTMVTITVEFYEYSHVIDQKSIDVRFTIETEQENGGSTTFLTEGDLLINNPHFYIIGNLEGYAIPILEINEVSIRKYDDEENEYYEDISFVQFLENTESQFLIDLYEDTGTDLRYIASRQASSTVDYSFSLVREKKNQEIIAWCRLEYLEKEGLFTNFRAITEFEETMYGRDIILPYVLYIVKIEPSEFGNYCRITVEGELKQYVFDAENKPYLKDFDEIPDYIKNNIEIDFYMEWDKYFGESTADNIDTPPSIGIHEPPVGGEWSITRADFDGDYFKSVRDIEMTPNGQIVIDKNKIYPCNISWTLEAYLSSKILVSETGHSYYTITNNSGADKKTTIYTHCNKITVDSPDQTYTSVNDDYEDELYLSILPPELKQISEFRTFFLLLGNSGGIFGPIGNFIYLFLKFLFCGASGDTFGEGAWEYINFFAFKGLSIVIVGWGILRVIFGTFTGAKQSVIEGIQMMAIPLIVNYIICYIVPFKVLSDIVIGFLNLLMSLGSIFGTQQYTATNTAQIALFSTTLILINILYICGIYYLYQKNPKKDEPQKRKSKTGRKIK